MIGKLWYILTLRCEEADRLRSQQALEPLTPAERTAMSLHQLVCKSCRIAARQVRILDEAISHLSDNANAPTAPETGPRLSPDARQRLSDALREADNFSEKSE